MSEESEGCIPPRTAASVLTSALPPIARSDYPNFFLNLYRLLDNQVLHVRYRPRFLRMLDTFLLSPKLPIALVASFIKRLARLCLSAPPAAIVSVMPFIYNLLKRHPGCMVLIHSEEQVEPGETYQGG